MILSSEFLKFLQYLYFRGQEIPTGLLSLDDLENPGQLPVQEVLMILSSEFLKFLQYLCFRGQEIHCWHPYWATMFGWLRKSRSTSSTEGTRRYWWFCFINFWNLISIHVFEVKESIADIPTELPCLSDFENPSQLPVQGYRWFCLMNFWNFFDIYVFEVEESIAGIPTEQPRLSYLGSPGQLPVQRYSKVLMIVSYEFSTFLHYLCFRGQATQFWHSYRAIMFGWSHKSRSASGSGGTDDPVLGIFEIPLLFMYLWAWNPLLIFLFSYPRLGELENLCKFPVLKVFEVTQKR